MIARCGQGIGLATARLLVAAGARVHGRDVRQPDTPRAAFTAAGLGNGDALSYPPACRRCGPRATQPGLVSYIGMRGLAGLAPGYARLSRRAH
jgi:NAD(P)-dependent dehydrogenase (short-subunit alcohol dehydrogenase family)